MIILIEENKKKLTLCQNNEKRTIIVNRSSTADRMNLKRESGGTPTRRILLCEAPHGTVVIGENVHDLQN